MKRSVLIAKLHGLRVTGADLHYEGSIQLDPDQYERVGMLPFEFVEVWNKTSGARIVTYVIPGSRGSRCCILNGAAARTCQPGDELIIAARTDIDPQDIAQLRPRVALFDADNALLEVIDYGVVADGEGWDIERRDDQDPKVKTAAFGKRRVDAITVARNIVRARKKK